MLIYPRYLSLNYEEDTLLTACLYEGSILSSNSPSLTPSYSTPAQAPPTTTQPPQLPTQFLPTQYHRWLRNIRYSQRKRAN